MLDNVTTSSGIRALKGDTLMKRFDDFTGMTFGWLSITKQAQPDEHFNTWWRATCRCGKERSIRASQIREGKFFTCGSEECRFWSKVDKTSSDKGCWLWTGAVKDTGYGVFKPSPHATVVKAPKYAWESTRGPVPKDKWLLHKCDDRRCCNPEHLYLGTHQDNMDDMKRRGRSKVPRLKVAESDRKTIRERYSSGASQTELAKEFGVGTRTIRRIIREVGG